MRTRPRPAVPAVNSVPSVAVARTKAPVARSIMTRPFWMTSVTASGGRDSSFAPAAVTWKGSPDGRATRAWVRNMAVSYSRSSIGDPRIARGLHSGVVVGERTQEIGPEGRGARFAPDIVNFAWIGDEVEELAVAVAGVPGHFVAVSDDAATDESLPVEDGFAEDGVIGGTLLGDKVDAVHVGPVERHAGRVEAGRGDVDKTHQVVVVSVWRNSGA